MAKDNEYVNIYKAEVIIAGGVAFASGCFMIEKLNTTGVMIARYVLYFLLMEALHEVCFLGYNMVKSKQMLDYQKLLEKPNKKFVTLVLSGTLLIYFNAKLIDEHFVLMYIGYLIKKYPDIVKSSSISYGVGMACSFFEGYLAHIIPNDGARFIGFAENIRIYQNRHRVVFPVKKLFIVITKSLYCPPDLKEFNKDETYPYLEACQVTEGVANVSNSENTSQSLEEVEKDVAGVKNRTYKNSAYKIHRKGADPVYLSAECATPLHTLHRVLKNRDVYEELGNINVEEVIEDFCVTLDKVIAKSPDCVGKCELIYIDDTDPSQNLAQILLDRIRAINPNFESLTRH